MLKRTLLRSGRVTHEILYVLVTKLNVFGVSILILWYLNMLLLIWQLGLKLRCIC